MKMKKSSGPDKVEQNMTPMIDIVFQLLTFFVMTFKIASQEGDFNIKMPAMGTAAASDEEPPKEIKVRMQADANGRLAQMSMGDRVLSSFPALHAEIMALVGTDTGPGSMADKMEVELDCDYNLEYENVVNAITAISGRLDSNGHVVKLIEKVKFAPQRGRL
jgi:biopolymer transport protein ExbD